MERLKHVPENVMNDIMSKVTLESALRECTVRGKGEKIKTNKPKDGIHAFIWRWARFHNGDDTTFPVTSWFDLANGIEQAYNVNISFAIYGEGDTRKVLTNYLESISDKLVDATGGNRYAGASRWAGLI